jgi:hypothetical protein
MALTDKQRKSLAGEANKILLSSLYDDGRCDPFDMSSHRWEPRGEDGWHTPADPEGNVTAAGIYLDVVCSRCGLPFQIMRAIEP